MRIFLLPLTTRQALVYCQRAAKPVSERTILDKTTQKTTDTWAKWETFEKGWQKQVVTYGNRALQRIPYQEWGLKSFPSSNANLQAEQITDETKFDVVYPANFVKEADVPKVLSRLARERKQLHFNRFVGSLVAIPFTIPFALIPVIPNLPFFYVAYRAWSHWKALKGSDHLDFILDHRLFRPITTDAVQSLYKRFCPHPARNFEFVTRSQVDSGEVQKEELLLSAGAHNEVAKLLEVPELSGEIERAVWQVEQEFRKQEQEKEKLQLPSRQNPSGEENEKRP
ncbi:hypothetical protein LTS08_005603 [Lithohypha guttulata]|nr:hypothetical protein LTS08_005603 [Lithohypha guttulata]